MSEYPITTRDANGWPLLAQSDFLRALPTYTSELASKLGRAQGYTGPIDVSAYDNNAIATKLERCILARFGPLCHLSLSLRVQPGSGTRLLWQCYAAGFRPVNSVYMQPPYGSSPMNAVLSVAAASEFLNVTAYSANGSVVDLRWTVMWLTNDPWPGRLPGPVVQ